MGDAPVFLKSGPGLFFHSSPRPSGEMQLMSMSGRFVKGFIAVCYLVMATNVAGVAQGCTCNDQAHGHDDDAAMAATMATTMDMADVDCTGGGPKSNHVGIQNWEHYLPAPEMTLISFQGGQIYAPRRTEILSSYGYFPDKIPI